MSATDRGRARPRLAAICCTCGEVRTVAASYRGKRPASVAGSDTDDPSCRWLRCSHCAAVTLHAVLGGRGHQLGSVSECPRERHNRATDRHARRVRRRIAGLAADGIDVLQDVAAQEMHLYGAALEVIEHDDQRRLQVRICTRTSTEDALRGLEAVEELIDQDRDLGHWIDSPEGRWRGVAWTGPLRA